MAATDWINSSAAVVAALGAGGGLFYAGRQLRSSRRTAQSQYLLDLDSHFLRYWDVHVALMRDGRWTSGRGPKTNEEWAEIEAYMGLFERLYVGLENNDVELRYIERFYKYRMSNLWSNPVIRSEKLAGQQGWESFHALSERLGLPRSS